MLVSRCRHLFQHVLQPLGLEVDDKLLLLPPVQVLEQPAVAGVVEVFNTDGADLPVVLSCLLHDGLQDGVTWGNQTHRSRTRGEDTSKTTPTRQTFCTRVKNL